MVLIVSVCYNQRLSSLFGKTNLGKYWRIIRSPDDIRAYVVKKDLIMSHIPIHPESLSRWVVNIHGHLHSNCVKTDWFGNSPIEDKRYSCVSVEHTEYKPVLLDTIIKKAGLKS